jgi:hypothetical protein
MAMSGASRTPVSRCRAALRWRYGSRRDRVHYNLRTDPYEFADLTSNSYWDWYIYHGYMILAAQRIAGAFADTFKEFPAIQRPNSFTIDDALRAMSEDASGGKQ